MGKKPTRRSNPKANVLTVPVICHNNLGQKPFHEPFVRTPDPNSFAVHVPNPVPKEWVMPKRKQGQYLPWAPGPGDEPSCPIPQRPESPGGVMTAAQLHAEIEAAGPPPSAGKLSVGATAAAMKPLPYDLVTYEKIFFKWLGRRVEGGELTMKQAGSVRDVDIRRGYMIGADPKDWSFDWLPMR